MSGLVLAYHGCDAQTRDGLLNGTIANLEPSENKYDWLGSGVYFFEDDPERAMLFAKASADHPDRRYSARPIKEPAVIGAVLSVTSWLDMTTQRGIREFSAAYRSLRATTKTDSGKLPSNKRAGPKDTDMILHLLDKAVFDVLHELLIVQSPPVRYDAVRGAFPQGKSVARSSAFKSHSHIQIAVRNTNCIRGWFRVRE